MTERNNPGYFLGFFVCLVTAAIVNDDYIVIARSQNFPEDILDDFFFIVRWENNPHTLFL